MVNKFLEILGSPRFWLITATAVVSWLNGMDFQMVMQVWAAAVVGIGTFDRAMNKVSGK